MVGNGGSSWYVMVEWETLLAVEEEGWNPFDRGSNTALLMATLLAVKISVPSVVLWGVTADSCCGVSFC